VTVIHLHQQLPKLIVPKTAQETLGNSNTLKNGRHEYLCDKLDPLQPLLHPQLGYIIIHILFQPETTTQQSVTGATEHLDAPTLQHIEAAEQLGSELPLLLRDCCNATLILHGA
jgi:hypothetical protein